MCYDVQQMLMFCSYMFLSVIKIFDDTCNHFLSYSWIFVLCFVVGFFLLFLCEGKNFWGNYQTFMEMVWKFFLKNWKCLCMINLIYEEKLSHHFLHCIDDKDLYSCVQEVPFT